MLTPRLSSYWLYFVTSTNFTLAKSLVESMKNEVIVKNDEMSNVIKHSCLTYEQALQNAFKRIAENMGRVAGLPEDKLERCMEQRQCCA